MERTVGASRRRASEPEQCQLCNNHESTRAHSVVQQADPRFLTFLGALAAMLEERGLPWIKARQASNIIHAIGKMQLRNPSTKRILEWISTPEIAAIFVEEGEPQEVANVAWVLCQTWI